MKTAAEIMDDNIPRELKIVRLWALAMLNYRQEAGDLAWDAMRKLTDPDVVTAIAFLTGYTTSKPVSRLGRWAHRRSKPQWNAAKLRELLGEAPHDLN